MALNDVAWHAGPGGNHHTVGIEHAGYARQTREEWLDEYSHAMLELSAQLTAQLCRRYELPVKLVKQAGLKRGDRGITCHRWISLAFKRSTHTDPGTKFPWDVYLEMVRAALS